MFNYSESDLLVKGAYIIQENNYITRKCAL